MKIITFLLLVFVSLNSFSFGNTRSGPLGIVSTAICSENKNGEYNLVKQTTGISFIARSNGVTINYNHEEIMKETIASNINLATCIELATKMNGPLATSDEGTN